MQADTKNLSQSHLVVKMQTSLVKANTQAGQV